MNDDDLTLIGNHYGLGRTASLFGIHAGPALVGNFGGNRFFDYTAYGDSINIAARLEAANKHLGTRICVSAGIAEAAENFRGRPVGELMLVGDGESLRGLHFAAGASPAPGASADRAAFASVLAQLGEYFAGARRTFDVPLDLRGSEFQRAVWAALLEIPYGETASYGEIARRVGRPGKARAVGRANGSNPIAVIVPCHRVIGADGTLTGYGGGLERKRLLLDLESGRAQLGVLSQPR